MSEIRRRYENPSQALSRLDRKVRELESRFGRLAGLGAGVTDHGALTGLGDDDHTQYLLTDGSRRMDVGAGLIFQNDTAGTANFQIDPNDVSGATFRLRIGGSATPVSKFWVVGGGDVNIARFETGGIYLDKTSNTQNLIPKTDLSHDLGTAALSYRNLYVQNIYNEAGSIVIDGNGAITPRGDLRMVGDQLFFNYGVETTSYLQHSTGSNYFRFVQAGTEIFRATNTGIQIPSGTVSTPGMRFAADVDTGIYRYGTHGLAIAQAGADAFRTRNSSTNRGLLILNGSVSVPSLAFANDADTGIYLPTTAQFAIAIASNQEFLLGTSGAFIPNAYNSTSGSAANVYVASDGRLYRSTSTERFKDDVRPWKGDASVLDLTPVTFYPMAGNPEKGEKMKRIGRRKLLGLTWEDASENFPRGATADQAIDWNAIVAGILAELKNIDARVTTLEAA